MLTKLPLPSALAAVAAAIASVSAGCGPAIAGGQTAAAAEQEAAEPAEEQLAIVQASHGGAQLFGGVRVARAGRFSTGSVFGAADAQAPTTGPVIDGPKMGHDPQVAVGDHFLIVYGSHTYEVFDKATGQRLPSDPSDLVAPAGDFGTIFAPLWHARDRMGAPNAQNINTHLRFTERDKLVCNQETPLRSTACVQEFYDTRIMWDELRKRFWIESAARNHLWHCGKGDDCDDEEVEGSKHSRTQARRYIAVAVSRTEDPRQGFHQYILVNEYADWPKIAVNDRYLVLSHRTSPNVYVFDADRLAAGNPDHGPVRVAKLGARSFPGARWLSPVTHHGPTNGVTWLLGSDGSKDVVPFALVNPDPTRAARPIVVPGPKVSLGAKLFTMSSNAVWRGGFLYFAHDEWAPRHAKEYRDIRVTRLPVRIWGAQPLRVWDSTEPRDGFLEAVIGGREPDDAPGDVVDYEMPAMDVNAAGDMVVTYSRKGFQTAADLPPEVRYSIVYHGEARARPGVLVKRGTASSVPDINENGKAGIDLAHAQVDPSDDRTVWIAHAYADGRSSWYRQVVAAVRP